MGVWLICTSYVSVIQGGQKRMSEPLELVSQTIMSCQVGAED